MRRTWSSVLVVAVSASLLIAAGTGEPPANDRPEDATVIEALPFVDEFDASTATGSPHEVSGCDRAWNGRSVFYLLRPDRDLQVEFKRDVGVEELAFISGDCSVWMASWHAVKLTADTDYLIRAQVNDSVEGVATFAMREYMPPELDIELSPLAELVDGNLHLAATLLCTYPGEVNLTFYAAQPNNDTYTMPRSSYPLDERADCDGASEHRTVVEPDRDGGEPSFLPGPVTIFWDIDGCHFDDWRYTGFRDCFHRAGEELVVAVPKVP